MKMTKLVVCLAAAALAATAADSAKSYRVKFFEKSNIGGTELQPGEYRVEVNGGMATIKAGKQIVEAPVKVEDSTAKTSSTTVRYSKENGKYKVEEIRIGGTNTKLVFSQGGGAGTPAN